MTRAARQLDMFSSPGAYPRGPGHRRIATSVAAANSIRQQIGPLHKRILSYLLECGPRGATYTEIMSGCALAAPTVCGRMVELRTFGFVRVSDFTRPTPSRRQAHVYQITQQGIAKARE